MRSEPMAMMRDDLRQRHHLRAQLAFGVGDHRLHDVAAEVRVLRALRRDRVADVGGPDHLVGRAFDLFALEQVRAVLVAGEVDHAVAARLQRLGDREQHGIAQTAAGEQHGCMFRNFGRRAGRAHHDDRFAGLQVRAQPARHAHLERDQRQQALLPIDPRAGQRDAFHQHRRDVAVEADVRAEPLEVLQAIELAGMKVPCRGGGADDDLDDGRRQPDDPLDAREQLIVEVAAPSSCHARSRAGCSAGSSAAISSANNSTTRG